MPTNRAKQFDYVIHNLSESIHQDEKGNFKVIDEIASKRASEMLSKIILEMSSEHWEELEASEDSLSDMSDEISFEELNTDPSYMDDMEGMKDMDSEDSVDDSDEEFEPDLANESKDLKNLLGSKDFDFSSIMEMDDHDMEMDRHDMDEDEDDDIVDGDEDFSDLQIGMDDAGMGDNDEYNDELSNDTDDEPMDNMDDDDMDDVSDDMEFDFDLDGDMDDDMEEMNHLDDMKVECDDMEEMNHLDDMKVECDDMEDDESDHMDDEDDD